MCAMPGAHNLAKQNGRSMMCTGWDTKEENAKGKVPTCFHVDVSTVVEDGTM